MRAISTFVVIGICVYLATWTVAYVWILGRDFHYYFEYLKLSWTRPGEIPAFIQWIAIPVTVLVLGILLVEENSEIKLRRRK